MVPQYTNDDFFTGETVCGEGVVAPCDAFGTAAAFATEMEAMPTSVERVRGKWWARLSAPGYLDATDWNGPFDTEAQARESIESMYEVDPETGEDLGDA